MGPKNICHGEAFRLKSEWVQQAEGIQEMTLGEQAGFRVYTGKDLVYQVRRFKSHLPGRRASRVLSTSSRENEWK